MTHASSGRPRPLNVHLRPGSPAHRKYMRLAGVPGLEPGEIAPGLPASPAHDLRFHGGRTLAALSFANVYVGADAWAPGDMAAIDAALAAAMSEPTLNNVMAQYFGAPPTSEFLGSQTLPGPAPDRMSQGDIENLVSTLQGQGSLAAPDFGSTVFNFLLPPGTVLTDNPAPGGQTLAPEVHRRRRGVPEDEEADSLNGLGGFHGSVAADGLTVYYAVGVYSQQVGDQANGIPVFDLDWKNVVATFYHELNEARPDPDVEQVIAGGDPSLLGWTSSQGEECGDFPVFEANPLTQVFQEVPLTAGGTAPVQFQYSNAVHGPEGPIDAPH